MLDLLADLVGRRVCVWFEKRLAIGTLCGVGDGLVCVDVESNGLAIRTFIALSAITALRAMNEKNG